MLASQGGVEGGRGRLLRLQYENEQGFLEGMVTLAKMESSSIEDEMRIGTGAYHGKQCTDGCGAEE